jgi:citrate lyase synthetase
MLQNVTIDTSKDIEIFGKYIAPVLDIKYRFVGDEPFDIITRQYNKNMNENLAQFGIKFIEIKRNEVDAQSISASRVRKLLKEKNMKKLENLFLLVLWCIYKKDLWSKINLIVRQPKLMHVHI